jgi:hypothetical protein
MREVMGQLRCLADAGSTALLIHHRPKSSEIMYRGSSDILAGVDVAFSVERDNDGLKMVGYKSRDSELSTIGIRVNFGKGEFHATDTHAVTAHRDAISILMQIVREHPGLTQNEIIKRCGLRRVDVVDLLRTKHGKLWTTEPGPRQAILYRPLNGSHDWFPTNAGNQFPEPVPGTNPSGSAIGSNCAEPVEPIPVVPRISTPKGGIRELVAPGDSQKGNP